MNISEELSKFEAGSKEYNFLQKVFDRLTPNFISKSKEEQMREARNSLDRSMQKYFALHIFSNAVLKATDNLEALSKATSSQSFSDSSSKSIHPLYLNMVHHSLPSGENSQDIKPFGLSQENTSRACFKSEAKARIFKESVERNIKEFFIEVIQCTGGTAFNDDNWKNALDRAMKDLESKATLLSSEATKGQTKKQLIEMTKTYYKELNEGVLLLQKLLSLHEQKAEFEANLAEYYFHQCKACFLKIKFLEMKILEMTYNKETIPVLTKISTQLQQSEQKLKEEENENTVALQQYLKLGEEFEHFVDEYTDLTKKIREQQWAIDELKRKDS